MSEVEQIIDDISTSLEDWVIDKRDDWREDFQSNYEEDFDQYYRLWRAQWSSQDKQRKSERSKLIAPALQQAVESNVAEVEEATFGRGKWFDLADEAGDSERQDIVAVRTRLQEDFDEQRVRKDISEVLINAAVYGTGIGELVIENVVERKPALQPINENEAEYGVQLEERFVVRLNPILPQNFLIDPVSTSIEDSIGVIIDQFVPRHQVEQLQEQGVYRDGYIEDAEPDLETEPDKELAVYPTGKIRLTKYYGLVPTALLEDEASVADEDKDGMYTEAVVIIANNGTLLKAIPNPYMMKDRPVVAFPWDIVPGRFWGRGVCEKGYMSQKALDTEMRARIDALALTVHPMMAMDVSRLPAGTRPQVKPGHTIFTNGPPQETLMPFKFGNLDPNTFQQSQTLSQMVQQATGAVDSTGLLSSVSGETKAGAVSMSLGAVIKRHKRTLINFQEAFLLPFVKKAAYRYMQFDPSRYPSQDWKFKASSTLGIIAREYEVSQLISLLQTMSPESPLYPTLIQSIVENMNLSNREELVEILKQAAQPTPEQMQAQQKQQLQQEQRSAAETDYFTSQSEEARAKAAKAMAEAQAVPLKARADFYQSVLADLQDGGEQQDFENRLAIVDRRLEEMKLKKEGQSANADPTGNGSNQSGIPGNSGTQSSGR